MTDQMLYEYDLEVFGYSGRLIDDHTFNSESSAREYIQREYGGDGGIESKLFKRDKNAGTIQEIQLSGEIK